MCGVELEGLWQDGTQCGTGEPSTVSCPPRAATSQCYTLRHICSGPTHVTLGCLVVAAGLGISCKSRAQKAHHIFNEAAASHRSASTVGTVFAGSLLSEHQPEACMLLPGLLLWLLPHRCLKNCFPSEFHQEIVVVECGMSRFFSGWLNGKSTFFSCQLYPSKI